MLRLAVIDAVKAGLTTLSNRVYQAFLTPPKPVRPYATVKLGVIQGSSQIPYAGDQIIEIYLVNDPDSFANLDVLENQLINLLNRKTITDQRTGESYEIAWEPGGGDAVDPEEKTISRMLKFTSAILREG